MGISLRAGIGDDDVTRDAAAVESRASVVTNVPARLDRLPWSRFHLMIVVALGITWILDGLEVTIVGSIGPALQDHRTLGLSAQDIGTAASAYIAGAVGGAVLFGWLTDRVGRRNIFTVTLAIYILGVLASGCSWNMWSFLLFRFVTGLGIGGEYAAINSAIDELIPARVRGRVDLIVNGTYWIGAALGALGSMVLLDKSRMDPSLGWRLAFIIGGVLGLGVIFLRRYVPESPRWLVTHGRLGECEQTMQHIERKVENCTGERLLPCAQTLIVHPRARFGFGAVIGDMLGSHRQRSLYVLVLMVAQAFLYNAVFFTYGMVLNRYEHVPSAAIGYYILPLAAANFAGPLLLGRFFDTIGRRRMIAATYSIAGVLMAVVAILFLRHDLTAATQTLGWVAVFFFASAAASSAYLTVSEIFPLETRALAIALFYAFGTILGGVGAPYLFGWLIDLGSVGALVCGYIGASLLMFGAAFTAWKIGVDAEGKSLEQIALPLSG